MDELTTILSTNIEVAISADELDDRMIAFGSLMGAILEQLPMSQFKAQLESALDYNGFAP